MPQTTTREYYCQIQFDAGRVNTTKSFDSRPRTARCYCCAVHSAEHGDYLVKNNRRNRCEITASCTNRIVTRFYSVCRRRSFWIIIFVGSRSSTVVASPQNDRAYSYIFAVDARSTAKNPTESFQLVKNTATGPVARFVCFRSAILFAHRSVFVCPICFSARTGRAAYTRRTSPSLATRLNARAAVAFVN